MTDPYLIGEAPSRLGDRYWLFPLSGRPAKVLCEAAGIEPEPNVAGWGKWTWALYDRFVCRNLIERYGQASPWSAPRAREAATELLRAGRPRVVVCLGRKVGEAFGLEANWGVWHDRVYALLPEVHIGPEPIEPDSWPDSWLHEVRCDIVVAPHPSGLSRLMNEPAMRALLGRVLDEATGRARELEARAT